MSFIGNMLDPSKSSGFQAQGATPQDVAAANGNVNNSLAQQQSFVGALQAQNGIGNQASVFNQLQGVANGGGPNPAQAMLAQSTGNNVAGQAAMMAGQRGASTNPGLIARQAAMQGGALQQQAAGQGAVMQANQSLGALNSLGGIAQNQVQNQQGALSGYAGSANANQANLYGNLNNQNSTNAGIAGENIKGATAMVGGLMNGAGAAAGMARGGMPGDAPKIPVPMHHAMAFLMGGQVPGTPQVDHNSYQNDTVPALLSSKEIVLPLSVTQSSNAPEAAAKFVAAILKNKASKK